MPESERLCGDEEIIRNSEVRNMRHNDCDDLLELQLQPKGTSSTKKRNHSYFLPTKFFADESENTQV